MPDHGPVETVEAARAGGFDAVGLWVDPAQWTPATTRDTRAALANAGLPLLDVEVIWLKPGDDIALHRKVIDVGAELGAANVLCVSSHPDSVTTIAALDLLCRHAEDSGMRVALEFGIFTRVRDLPSALAILDRVGHPLSALLVDPIHVDRSDSSIAAIAAVDPALMPYAQFCDAPGQRPDPEDFDAVITDAIDLRRQCGEGALALESLYRALPPGIPLSIELRSRRLRDDFPDSCQRARAVANTTRRWLAGIA